jgi:hypothetical protein
MRNLLLYALVLAALYLAARYSSPDVWLEPPAGELDERDLGAGTVPPPSRRDETIRVETGHKSSSTGTAFAIAPGTWMSARHVVEGCDQLYLLKGATWGSGRVPANSSYSPNSDLSVITAAWQETGFPVARAVDLRRGQTSFIIGYPQGKEGELRAKLLGRGRAVFSSRRRMSEPVLVWAETGRSAGFSGSIGGISGGPAFDAHGNVIGVAVAETLRRGRVYTAAPRSINRARHRWEIDPEETKVAGKISRSNYKQTGDYLRQTGRVVKVLCLVD